MKINKINKILLSLAIFTFILSVKVGIIDAQSPICPVGQIPDPDNGACVIPSIKYEIFNYLAEGNTVLSEIAYDGNEALPDGSYTPNVNSVGPTYGIKIDIESPINGLNIEYRLASIYGLGSLSPWFSNGNFAYMPIESGPPFYRDGVQLSGIEIRLVNPPPGIKEIRYKANCYTFYFDGSWHYEQAQTPWTNVGFAFCPDVDPKMQVQGISIELVTEPVYGTPPPVTTFDYSLSNGGDRYISQGGSVTNPITATLVTAPTEPVDLSVLSIKNSSNVDVLNQANGINATISNFIPNPVIPTQTSQLTLTATAEVPAGVYLVDVYGIGDGITKSTSYNVTVDTSNLTVDTGTTGNGGNSTCTKGSIVAIWDAVDGATNYALYNNTVSETVPIYSGPLLTYVNDDLDAGLYEYTLRITLSDGSDMDSQPKVQWAIPDTINKCLTCDLNVDPSSIISGESSTVTWDSTNATADSCNLKEEGLTIFNTKNGSDLRTNITNNRTYVFTCNGPEPLPGDDGICTLNKTVTVSESAPGNLNLWLNNNELLTSIRVRPRQEFGLNWRGSDLPGLQPGTCTGNVYDSNGQVQVDEWINDPLPDNQDSTSLPITTELNKGIYTFEITCLNDVGGVISPVSDTVDVTVTQAKIEER